MDNQPATETQNSESPIKKIAAEYTIKSTALVAFILAFKVLWPDAYNNLHGQLFLFITFISLVICYCGYAIDIIIRAVEIIQLRR